MSRNLVLLTDVQKHRPWIPSLKWLRRGVYEGWLPYHKVRGRVLIDLADLDRMVEEGRHERHR